MLINRVFLVLVTQLWTGISLINASLLFGIKGSLNDYKSPFISLGDSLNDMEKRVLQEWNVLDIGIDEAGIETEDFGSVEGNEHLISGGDCDRICTVELRPCLGRVKVCSVKCAPRSEAETSAGNEQQCQTIRQCTKVKRPGIGFINVCRNQLVCG